MISSRRSALVRDIYINTRKSHLVALYVLFPTNQMVARVSHRTLLVDIGLDSPILVLYNIPIKQFNRLTDLVSVSVSVSVSFSCYKRQSRNLNLVSFFVAFSFARWKLRKIRRNRRPNWVGLFLNWNRAQFSAVLRINILLSFANRADLPASIIGIQLVSFPFILSSVKSSLAASASQLEFATPRLARDDGRRQWFE